MTLVDLAEANGRAFTSALTRDEQRTMGAFMSPAAIATFMARRLVADVRQHHVRVLEPSAGGGILAAAVVEELLIKQDDRPGHIELLLYEQDERCIAALTALCREMESTCRLADVRFEYVVRCEDFLLSDLAVSGTPIEGLLTIANPPFFKLNKTTDRRAELHAYAVYGQPNIYSLFMAATARLTAAGGRWCFITPRSWMNGQYFKAARHTMFRCLTVDSLHAFESRTDGFEEDAVLQEMVITWATGRSVRDAGLNVLLTRSHGLSDLDDGELQAVPTERVVSVDEHAMVTMPALGLDPFEDWSATLSTYGLQVSTGPVVAFRAKARISEHKERNTVPLLWLQHVQQQSISWPIAKKREHIRVTPESAWMLVPNAPMVVMRRFSPKEDARRVTCAAYGCGLDRLPGDVIGLENHLNYIYRPGGRMGMHEARGLAAFLASSIVDGHFRALSGSTQVNATELRKLPLPPLAVIEEIGRNCSAKPSLEEIDVVVDRALGIGVHQSKKAA